MTPSNSAVAATKSTLQSSQKYVPMKAALRRSQSSVPAPKICTWRREKSTQRGSQVVHVTGFTKCCACHQMCIARFKKRCACHSVCSFWITKCCACRKICISKFKVGRVPLNLHLAVHKVLCTLRLLRNLQIMIYIVQPCQCFAVTGSDAAHAGEHPRSNPENQRK